MGQGADQESNTQSNRALEVLSVEKSEKDLDLP